MKSTQGAGGKPRGGKSSESEVVEITAAMLGRSPLPRPDQGGDKEERGRVMVVGGAPEMPGAIILAATTALRAGAGKLQIATCRSIAAHVATAVPEARVFALPETPGGAIGVTAAPILAERAASVDALLIGPGMIDEGAVTRLLLKLMPRLERPVVVLDAAALAPLARDGSLLHHLRGHALVTPHAGEMAKLLDMEKSMVQREPWKHARGAAAGLRAVVALKGAETWIAEPDGRGWRSRVGNIGLATSGSGDTLSGIIAGLAARGAEPWLAAAWGVYLHGLAGDRLSRRMGPLGYLPRELLAEIPPLMRELGKHAKG